MKILAFYLPQYHVIEENNKWWGDGFTEWVNVKRAKPLFKGHYQPRVPLNKNYYDLLDNKTMEWQADIAKKYGVDGFCFYHYWFGGHKLLEKPAELLLNNKNINLNYCFSWANEPWTRSWDGSTKDVLMSQIYGDKADWLSHFNYLKPFFEDERYIKYNGKPIFLLYRSASFERCSEWMMYWRELAKDTLFKDIHFVSTLTSFEKDKRNLDFDAYLNFEPMCTFEHYMGIFHPLKRKVLGRIKKIINKEFGLNFVEQKLSYDSLWEKILRKEFNEHIYSGAFVDWDNTPRKSTRGLVISGGNPDKFKNYFSKLYEKSKQSNVPFVFINAWNEWAEGTYLEPDERYGFSYLEAIKSTVDNIN